jgi:hypothetical protein
MAATLPRPKGAVAIQNPAYRPAGALRLKFDRP